MTLAVLNRPRPGSKIARVWDIADEKARELRRLPRGREVAEAYVAEGGNWNTAMTQYSHWRSVYLASAARPSGGDRKMLRVAVGPDGQIVLPAEIRKAMGLGQSAEVIVHLVDGELRMIAPEAGLARAQALVQGFDTGQGSPVDELIRGRRAEAGNE